MMSSAALWHGVSLDSPAVAIEGLETLSRASLSRRARDVVIRSGRATAGHQMRMRCSQPASTICRSQASVFSHQTESIEPGTRIAEVVGRGKGGWLRRSCHKVGRDLGVPGPSPRSCLCIDKFQRRYYVAQASNSIGRRSVVLHCLHQASKPDYGLPSSSN